MRKKIVAGNWKMNKTITEGLSLIEAIKTLKTEIDALKKLSMSFGKSTNFLNEY